MIEDSFSFSTTRTCVVNYGTGAAAVTAPSSADIGLKHRLLKVTEAMICRANALVQTTLVRRSRSGACHLFDDSPSFSTTRTCAVSNGIGAAAATAPSSADTRSNNEHPR